MKKQETQEIDYRCSLWSWYMASSSPTFPLSVSSRHPQPKFHSVDSLGVNLLRFWEWQVVHFLRPENEIGKTQLGIIHRLCWKKMVSSLTDWMQTLDEETWWWYTCDYGDCNYYTLPIVPAHSSLELLHNIGTFPSLVWALILYHVFVVCCRIFACIIYSIVFLELTNSTIFFFFFCRLECLLWTTSVCPTAAPSAVEVRPARRSRGRDAQVSSGAGGSRSREVLSRRGTVAGLFCEGISSTITKMRRRPKPW